MSVVTRTELVRPAMCGHNSQLVARIGDWTWDAVGEQCGTDVLRAKDPAGSPTYLSFYYYRVRGSRRFHLRTPTFGDRLHVASGVFGFGSESVLTLHRITRTPAEADDGDGDRGSDSGRDGDSGRPDHRPDQPEAPAAIDPDEFYAFADEDSLYVENFNRWVTRGAEGSNRGLVKSSPAGFQHRHLPGLPEKYSPRLVCQQARDALSFVADPGLVQVGEVFQVDYRVDPSRDLNGVGLLYFASYFSIIDWVTLRWWEHAGRTLASFFDRVAVDQQVCYLGNADADCVVAATVRHRRPAGAGDREVLDIILHERGSGRLLAVCSISILTGGTP